ncbi:MAG: LysM peptidoglycan-binding domain-containing protein [Clostridia bacterium]|nr:LysM peptidoglycan-binding domain-containing protein [Clostridia bacterium]
MENQTAFYTEDLLGEEVFAECGGEFLLPDYLPEVRRILAVHARAVDEGHFLGESAELAGKVVFRVLYTDDAGELCATALDTPYEATLPLSDSTAGVFSVSERAEGATVRLLAPRRLTLRTRVRILPHLWITRGVETPSGESLVTLTRTVTDGVTVNGTAGELSMEATLPLSDPERRVLSADAAASVRECRYERDGVRMRGDVIFSLLLSGEELPALEEVRASFDEWIPMPDGEGCTLRAIAKLGEVSTTPCEDGVQISCPLSLSVEGRRAVSFPVVYDAFSTDAPTRTECREFVFSAPIEPQVRRVEIEGSIPVEEDGTLIYTHSRQSSVACAVKDGEVTVDGMLETTAIIALSPSEGGVLRYTAHTENLPFRHRYELKDAASISLTPSVGGVRIAGRCDGGRLLLSGDLELTVDGVRGERLSLPIALHPAERSETLAADTVTVYYVKPNDTLFSVARDFCLPPSALAAANKLADEVLAEPDSPQSLDGVAYLILNF